GGDKDTQGMKGLLAEQAWRLALPGTEDQRPQRGRETGHKLLECHPRWRRGELSLSGDVCYLFPVPSLHSVVSSMDQGRRSRRLPQGLHGRIPRALAVGVRQQSSTSSGGPTAAGGSVRSHCTRGQPVSVSRKKPYAWPSEAGSILISKYGC